MDRVTHSPGLGVSMYEDNRMFLEHSWRGQLLHVHLVLVERASRSRDILSPDIEVLAYMLGFATSSSKDREPRRYQRSGKPKAFAAKELHIEEVAGAADLARRGATRDTRGQEGSRRIGRSIALFPVTFGQECDVRGAWSDQIPNRGNLCAGYRLEAAYRWESAGRCLGRRPSVWKSREMLDDAGVPALFFPFSFQSGHAHIHIYT